MKKFSFIGSVLLLVAVITFLFIGCQKESAVTADETATAGNEDAVMKGIETTGSSDINGLISQEDAQRMAAEFGKKLRNGDTKSVGYATKDLIAYLKVLNNKYKADSVYVVFGVYDKKTAHRPSQIGTTTVFFMGNNKTTGNGRIKTDGVMNDDPNASSFLNGGSQMEYP